jgi:hypothetical protein
MVASGALDRLFAVAMVGDVEVTFATDRAWMIGADHGAALEDDKIVTAQRILGTLTAERGSAITASALTYVTATTEIHIQDE